ncbi:hypothetical protein [Allorhodopirellula heiligendammensis]|uniref:Uncharacterized protein n=1 Tax=Allorhodopirellula heiligendammensis TaxID=2714739 RepID=A0A5C6BE65_9BACT|nr:hypothetical protein [Allorhodopirellula heiligendammensis]TWU09937.1 hypothetical protein Poly21_52650 [Allorhodopirellula heiligendammensis]
MINPYEPATEVDESSERQHPDKRPSLQVIAAIIFVFKSLFFLISGSVVESGGAFLVGFVCWAVGKMR